MKKNIKFDKSIEFSTMIGEICSISLEHTLKFVNQSSIEGDFIVEGSYKLTEASQLIESFSYNIPVEILLTEALELDSSAINIIDFYYEIENDSFMICYIEVEISGIESIFIEKVDEVVIKGEDKVEDIKEVEVVEESVVDVRECDMDNKIGLSEESIIENTDVEVIEPVKSLFSSFKDDEDSYKTYSVYIMRINDTIESVLDKYKITKEEIIAYNDLDKLKVGSKIIVPCCNE